MQSTKQSIVAFLQPPALLAVSYLICQTAMRRMSRIRLLAAKHGGGLETAVHQAIFAARVVARAKAVPIGYVDELAVGEVMGVAAQIARAAPAADVESRIGPGRALQFAPAAEKLQIDRRGREFEAA